MSLTADTVRLVFGLLVGMVLPRFPLLFFTRFLSMERELPPHPDPIPITIPLIQRMLLMRRIHIMCWVIAIFPLGLGILVLQNSPEPFAIGLVVGVSWFAISRAVPIEIGQGFGVLPLSRIQQINNLREPQSDCCEDSELQWEVRSIRCNKCRQLVLEIPRPDLGRLRSDGRIMGALRVILMDGRSVFPIHPESVVTERPQLLSKFTEEE